MTKYLRNAAAIFLAAALFLAPRVQAQGGDPNAIRISGSDTMNMLSTTLAEAYRAANPQVKLSVTGGGTGRGIADLLINQNDIAQASRPMSAGERDKAKAAGLDPKEHIVALDGIAIIVHEKNPVKDLSLAQLAAIYTGAVKNWKDVGGPDRPITVYAREANSGTYDFFKEHVLAKKDFGPGVNYLAATASIGSSVAAEENAIGFGGIGYFAQQKGVTVLAVREKKGDPAVSPKDEATGHVNVKAIQDGSYPISRPLFYYTPKEPVGETKKFLDWALSPAGQAVVAKTEYIPLK